MNFKLLKPYLLLIFIFSCTEISAAYEHQDPLHLKNSLESIEFSNSEFEELDRLKREIKQTAYSKTLLLCEGYRRSLKMGPHPFHNKYMLNFTAAMKPWLNIYLKGALLSFNSLKSKYNSNNVPIYSKNRAFLESAKLKVNRFTNEFYFSAYTLYFVNSAGFAKGAMDCLNTYDPKQINRFLVTVVGMDLMGTTSTYAATSASISLLIKKLAPGLIGRTFNFAINKTLRTLKNKTVKYGLLASGAIAASYFTNNYIKNKDKLRDAVDAASNSEKILDDSNATNKTAKLIATFRFFDQNFKDSENLSYNEVFGAECINVLPNLFTKKKTNSPYRQVMKWCEHHYQDFLNALEDWSTEDIEYWNNYENHNDDLNTIHENFYPILKYYIEARESAKL